MNEGGKSLKACAGFPEGIDVFGDIHLSAEAVNECLVGKRLSEIEFVSYNTIKFVFDDGTSASLTPSGIEGDDLDLHIVSAADDNGSGAPAP